jgi:flagellar M-ring protein FliF
MFDRFRKFTAQQQIAIVAVAAAAICILCIGVWYAFLRVPYKALFTGLQTNDAATIVAELERRKVPYRLSDDGATIYVPADTAERTRLAVMTEDLPLKGTVGFELFDRSDMGLTDFAQKINYLRALQGELERTIGSLDGVDSVRVHLSLGEDRVFRDDTVPPKASVTVHMRQGLTLSTDSARGIQRLVSASVPNLDAANVVVLDSKGDVVDTASAPQTVPSNDGAQAEELNAIERYYASRLRMAVERAYPLNTITVKVSAATEASTFGQGGDAQQDWSPANRGFPLKIGIASVLALDAAAEDNVRDLAATTVGFDPGKGDSLDFTLSPMAEPPTQASVPQHAEWPRSLPGLGAPNAAVGEEIMAAAALLATVAVAVFLLLFGLRRPRRLSTEQHAELAARLRAALDAGGGNVV